MQGRAGRAWVLVGAVTSVVAMACASPQAPAEPEQEASTGAAGSSSGAESSGGGAPGPAVPLVRAETWALATAAEDPFVDHRPTYVQCEVGFDVETGLFEVSTELCLYGAFVQPSLAEIHAGDELEVVLLHDALYSAEGETVAHVAVALGSTVAWQVELPIPSEAGQVRQAWVAPDDVEIGSPVHFHLHNHGTNNYRLVSLTVAER